MSMMRRALITANPSKHAPDANVGHNQSCCSKANCASDYCADNVARGYPMLKPQFVYLMVLSSKIMSSRKTRLRQPAWEIVDATSARGLFI